MFTGIIEELGTVKSLKNKGTSCVLSVAAKIASSDTPVGASISVNGVCLTVTGNSNNMLTFDILQETLKTTNLGILKPPDKVNIERALKADSRIGGHFVTGHIDCTARIRHRQDTGNNTKIEFQIQLAFLKYIVPKGSVAVDGINLTIGEIYNNSFSVYIIPHTLANTTLGFKKQGDTVNIELDILAKLTSAGQKESKITPEFLSEHGFI